MDEIMARICKATNYQPEEVRGHCKCPDLVALRAIFTEEALKIGYGKSTIASYLSGRDHSAVVHYYRRYKKSDYYFKFKKKIEEYVSKMSKM